MHRVLLPGSFDPFTIGHYDIVERCASLFDEVYVTVFFNSAKDGWFTVEERQEMIHLACKKFPNVVVDACTGELVANYAQRKGISTLIKGVRNGTDFDYEYQLSLINRSVQKPEIDTLLLPSRAEYMHISSTVVREMLRYKKEIAPYVPTELLAYIKGIER